MRSASSASVTRRIEGCVPSLWMSQRSKCSSGPAFIRMSGGGMIGPAFMSAADSASSTGSREANALGMERPRPARGACERLADAGAGALGLPRGIDAGRQARGARRDRAGRRPVLTREPGQRAGLGVRDLGAIAGLAHGLGDHIGAEGARREEHYLAVG